MSTADARGVPRIEHLNRYMGVLERRREWLAKRVADPDRRQSSKDFDAEEQAAIKAALVALRFHRTTLEDELTAVLALDELVQALEREGNALHNLQANADSGSLRVQQALAKARALLAEVG